jgi:ABC-type transport system involved in multi-copper enzyme maturation permease subunit
VNPTLIVTFWMHRLRSPLRMVFVVLSLLSAAIQAMLMPLNPGSAGGGSILLLLIFCTGMISQDVSNGTAHLILARPVRRSEYVFSRYAAVVLATLGVYFIQVLLAAFIMNTKGGPLDAGGLVPGIISQLTLIFGVSAVFAFLSSVARGMGDLGLFAVLVVVAGIAGDVLRKLQAPRAETISDWLAHAVYPVINDSDMMAGHGVPWLPIARYFVTVVTLLVAARYALGRRELTYA